jgi:hypothetical protein
MNFLITEPYKTIKLIFLTLIIETKFYMFEVIGSVGHMLNINYYFNFYLLTLLFVLYLIFENLEFSEKKTFYLFIIIFTTALAVIMTIYLNTNTIEKYETIKNVRGRYFIILFFIIACGFSFKKVNNLSNRKKIIFTILLLIVVLINLTDNLSVQTNIVLLIFSYLIVFKQYFKIFFKLLFPHFNLLILYNMYNFYY